jgi:hypothetical protein
VGRGLEAIRSEGNPALPLKRQHKGSLFRQHSVGSLFGELVAARFLPIFFSPLLYGGN